MAPVGRRCVYSRPASNAAAGVRLPQPFVCDLPDARASRALRDMHNSLAATAALITVVSAAQLGALPLAAAAILLLGMALNEIHRHDR